MVNNLWVQEPLSVRVYLPRASRQNPRIDITDKLTLQAVRIDATRKSDGAADASRTVRNPHGFSTGNSSRSLLYRSGRTFGGGSIRLFRNQVKISGASPCSAVTDIGLMYWLLHVPVEKL